MQIVITFGFATMYTAMFNPFGSTDIIDWSSNYGRDLNLVHLVTKRLSDCRQYIQLADLGGSLLLNYPSCFTPATSRFSQLSTLVSKSDRRLTSLCRWPVQRTVKACRVQARIIGPGVPEVEGPWTSSVSCFDKTQESSSSY